MKMYKLEKEQRIWRGGLSFLMLLGLGVLRLVNPSQGGFQFSNHITQELFGLPCPFCGITRGTHAFLNGEILRAFYLNMATMVVVAGTVLLIIVWATEAYRGKIIPWFAALSRWAFRSWKLFCVGLFVFWVVHISLALTLPKQELINPDAPFFPETLLKR